MFDDGNQKKQFFDDILFVGILVAFLIVFVAGLGFAARDSDAASSEIIPTEPLYTVEYEEPEPSNDFAYEETIAECNHNWVISEEHSTLIRNVKLACVASEGIEKVYLTRHRDMFNQTLSDIYIAYDENLEDITLEYLDGVFKIEYISTGVDMETPHLEEYEFTLYDCEKCNEFKHVPAEKLTMYKFYIPEGSYLISH